MLPVQRDVEHLREEAFDAEFLVRDEAHELADGFVAPERDERAEVAVAVRAWRGEQRLHQVRRFLVRRLRARRHRAAIPGHRGAIADRIHVVVARGLQRRAHHELVDPVRFEPVEVLEHIVAADAGGPDGEVAAHDLSAGGTHAVSGELDDLWGRGEGHAEVLENGESALRDVVRQSGEDARDRFDDREPDLGRGDEVREPISGQHADRVVQLGGELHARGPGADDRDVDRAPVVGIVRPEARVHQAAMEQVCLPRVVDREGVLPHAGRAEVVRLAADGDHELVVGDAPLGKDPLVLVVAHLRDHDLPRLSVEARQRAEREGEAVPARLREEIELVLVDIHAACGDFVQQRFPQVRTAAIDERDVRACAPAVAIAQPRGELEAARAAAHDDEARRHQSAFFASLPPRKRDDQRALHLSHSSSAIAGSMRRYWNLLSGLSTERLEGTRLCALMISWPWRESMKSARRRAASACGARRATPTELGCPYAGCSGFQSIGAPLSFSLAMPWTCVSSAISISPAATISAISVWPLRIEGFIAASLRKYDTPGVSPIDFTTDANQATSSASSASLPFQRGCSRSP